MCDQFFEELRLNYSRKLHVDEVWLEAIKANILAHESVAAVSNADDIVKAYIERFCK